MIYYPEYLQAQEGVDDRFLPREQACVGTRYNRVIGRLTTKSGPVTRTR